MVPECKPEWKREAITVFSKLPSLRRLQATPPLQTSLLKSANIGNGDTTSPLENGDVFNGWFLMNCEEYVQVVQVSLTSIID